MGTIDPGAGKGDLVGATNVATAYALYAGRVPATSMCLLAYMALVSKDNDSRPWFGKGHAALADAALGRQLPHTRADIAAVERAITPLLAVGAIEADRRGSVRTSGPNTVRYRLNLSPQLRLIDIDVPRVDKRGDKGRRHAS